MELALNILAQAADGWAGRACQRGPDVTMFCDEEILANCCGCRFFLLIRAGAGARREVGRGSGCPFVRRSRGERKPAQGLGAIHEPGSLGG